MLDLSNSFWLLVVPALAILVAAGAAILYRKRPPKSRWRTERRVRVRRQTTNDRRDADDRRGDVRQEHDKSYNIERRRDDRRDSDRRRDGEWRREYSRMKWRLRDKM